NGAGRLGQQADIAGHDGRIHASQPLLGHSRRVPEGSGVRTRRQGGGSTVSSECRCSMWPPPRSGDDAWASRSSESARMAAAWAMTDPRLRLVRSQAWIWNNRKDADIAAVGRDELARALAQERPDHPLWGDFAATEVHQMTGVYGTFRPENWGASSGPSAVGA